MPENYRPNRKAGPRRGGRPRPWGGFRQPANPLGETRDWWDRAQAALVRLRAEQKAAQAEEAAHG